MLYRDFETNNGGRSQMIGTRNRIASRTEFDTPEQAQRFADHLAAAGFEPYREADSCVVLLQTTPEEVRRLLRVRSSTPTPKN